MPNIPGIAIEVCMDEAVTAFGSKLYLVGTPGTLVTTPEDNYFYDLKTKNIVNSIRPFIHSAVKKVTTDLGLFGFYCTSHSGCGALGLQNISKSAQVELATRQFVKDHPDYPPFIQHIVQEKMPVNQPLSPGHSPKHLGDLQMLREETDHVHRAKRVIFTTGGFINSDEIKAINSGVLTNCEVVVSASGPILSKPRLFNQSFIVSADWLVQSLVEGADRSEMSDYFQFILRLTQKIMGDENQLELMIFNAQRLKDQGRQNSEIIRQMVYH